MPEHVTTEERLKLFSDRKITVMEYERRGWDLAGDVTVALARLWDYRSEFEARTGDTLD